jgi:hypothetical protein
VRPSPTGRQSPIDISRTVPDRQLAPLNLDLEQTSVVLNNPGYNVRAVPAIRQELKLNGDPSEQKRSPTRRATTPMPDR